MRLSAGDCLWRGLCSLRANWELVLIYWAQNLTVVVLTVLGFLPLLMVMGLGIVSSLENPGDFQEQLQGALDRLTESWPLLVIALLVSLAIWFVALVVLCYFQAGIYGVLVAGDRQALPGEPRNWHLFRAFSLADFAGWGSRYVWRFFWLVNLFFLALLLPLLVALAGLLAMILGGESWGPGVVLGMGCLGGLVLMVLFLSLTLWFALACADLAREESGPLLALRRSLHVLRRRLGAVLLLFFVFLALSMAVGFFFGVSSFFIQVVLKDQAVVRLGVSMALTAVEWLAYGAMTVFYGATYVALVRHELPEGSRT